MVSSVPALQLSPLPGTTYSCLWIEEWEGRAVLKVTAEAREEGSLFAAAGGNASGSCEPAGHGAGAAWQSAPGAREGQEARRTVETLPGICIAEVQPGSGMASQCFAPVAITATTASATAGTAGAAETAATAAEAVEGSVHGVEASAGGAPGFGTAGGRDGHRPQGHGGRHESVNVFARTPQFWRLTADGDEDEYFPEWGAVPSFPLLAEHFGIGDNSGDFADDPMKETAAEAPKEEAAAEEAVVEAAPQKEAVVEVAAEAPME